ncbi:MAG: hypothetical protein ACJ8F4_10585 [Sphingomonas sp.]
MRSLMLIATAGLLASCTRPVAPPEARFAQVIAGRTAGPAQTCISNNPAENLHVLDPRTVAYGYGRTIWIDRLAADCPGLNEANTTIVEAGVGGQYCRGDRVRGLEPGAIIAGPGCNLGDWVPYRQP